jgi:hypothetical protein
MRLKMLCLYIAYNTNTHHLIKYNNRCGPGRRGWDPPAGRDLPGAQRGAVPGDACNAILKVAMEKLGLSAHAFGFLQLLLFYIYRIAGKSSS